MCLLVYSERLAKSALWSTRADNRTTPLRVNSDIKGHSSAFGRKKFNFLFSYLTFATVPECAVIDFYFETHKLDQSL